MIHGFIEIGPPSKLIDCQEYLNKVQVQFSNIPLGISLSWKYYTTDSYIPICEFFTEKGMNYAYELASKVGVCPETG
jgi:hypothetical protein